MQIILPEEMDRFKGNDLSLADIFLYHTFKNIDKPFILAKTITKKELKKMYPHRKLLTR